MLLLTNHGANRDPIKDQNQFQNLLHHQAQHGSDNIAFPQVTSRKSTRGQPRRYYDEYFQDIATIEPLLGDAMYYVADSLNVDLPKNLYTQPPEKGSLSLWSHLPPYIARLVVSKFLTVHDICNLERSLLNAKDRDVLKDVYVGMKNPSIYAYPKKTVAFLRWCMKRKIDLKEIKLHEKLPKGMPAFHYACRERMLDIAALLYMLNGQVGLNAPIRYSDDVEKLTPLQHAFFSEHWDVVLLLLILCQADANSIDSHKNMILHYASESGNSDLVRLLIENGNAIVNIAGSKGYTPLHHAAEFGYVDVARFLLIADRRVVSSKNNKGKTPLHLALRQYHVAMCNLLVCEYCARVDVEDYKGRTAIDFIKRRNVSAETAHSLQEANAFYRRNEIFVGEEYDKYLGFSERAPSRD